MTAQTETEPRTIERLMADLASAVRSATDPRGLAKQVCRALVEAFGFHLAGVVLTSDNQSGILVYLSHNKVRRSAPGSAISCRWCRQPMFPLRTPLSQHIADCHAIHPLLSNGQPSGYLFAVAGGSGKLDGFAMAWLPGAALVLESSLERMRLQASSRHPLQRMEALHRIGLEVASTVDPHAQMDLLLRNVLRELGADLAALYLLDASGTQLVMAHQLGAIHRPLWRDLKFSIGEGAAGWIAQHRVPLAIPDVNLDPRWVRPHPTRTEHIVSYLGVPLLAEKELVGVLDVATRTYRQFSEEEVSFLAAVAAHAGTALMNSNLLGFLRRLVENAQDIIFRITLRPEVALDYVSPAAEAITGYSLAELYSGMDFLSKLMEPDDLQRVQPLLQGSNLIENPLTIPIRHKDGHRVWIELRTTPMLDRDGRVIAVEGIARDVTSQREAEERLAWMLQEQERKLKQLQALYEIAMAMTNPSNVSSLVQRVIGHVRDLLQADYVLLYRAVPDPQGRQLLRLASHTGLDHDSLQRFGPWRPGEPSVTGQAALLHRPVFVKELSQFPYQPETRDALERLGVRSILGLPLLADGNLIGVLNVLWCHHKETDDEMLAILKTLASLLATGLRGAQLLEETVSQAKRLEALYKVATAINRHGSLSRIFDTALEQVVQILGADRGGIALADPDGSSFTVVAEYGNDTPSALGRRIPGNTPLEKQLVRERRAVAVPDLANCPELGPAASVPLSLGIRAMLIVPIIVGNNVIGTMGIDSMTVRQFTDDDISVAQAIAHQISAAVERARLLEVEQERVAELTALYELSRELSETPVHSEAVLETLTRRAVADIPCTMAVGMLIEGDEVVIVSSHGRRTLRGIPMPGTRRPMAAYPALLRAGTSLEPVILERRHAPTQQELRELFPATIQHLCIVALKVSDQLLGFLLLGEARNPKREPFGSGKLKLARAMAEQTASALARAQLFHRLEESYLQTVLALAKAVEAKDTYTSEHAQRIAELALEVGKEMGLGPEQLEDLRYGAILHDIGKLAVPDAILRKPGPLDQQEWAIIRRHPAVGAEILKSVHRLRGAAQIVRHHHERWDGKGYPDGLSGTSIPLGSRILAVVDSFIAMTDQRVYRAPKSTREALEELDQNAGTQFDPTVVKVFKRVWQRTLQAPVPTSKAVQCHSTEGDIRN